MRRSGRDEVPNVFGGARRGGVARREGDNRRRVGDINDVDYINTFATVYFFSEEGLWFGFQVTLSAVAV